MYILLNSKSASSTSSTSSLGMFLYGLSFTPYISIPLGSSKYLHSEAHTLQYSTVRLGEYFFFYPFSSSPFLLEAFMLTLQTYIHTQAYIHICMYIFVSHGLLQTFLVWRKRLIKLLLCLRTIWLTNGKMPCYLILGCMT